MPQGTTYSFKDLVVAFSHPLITTIQLTGGLANGVDTISFQMATEHGTGKTAADGTVMPEFKPGRMGKIVIATQQTSILHHALLVWYNLVESQATQQNLTNWAAGTLVARAILDGALHNCTGVSPIQAWRQILCGRRR